MKSMASSNKRGSISGTVIKEDLKRFWPVPVISLIVMLASGSLLLMEELARLKKEIKPHEILLVVDALTGQDAVNAAQGFNDKLGIDGIIMTKLDGDARGGAALSAKKVTGKPIKFVGMGEKADALEPFHPDRMASRILDMTLQWIY